MIIFLIAVIVVLWILGGEMGTYLDTALSKKPPSVFEEIVVRIFWPFVTLAAIFTPIKRRGRHVK